MLFVGVPLLPRVGGEGLIVDINHLLDRNAVFFRKSKIALIVRRYAHHRAIAVAHQHVVTDPYRHLLAGERVGDGQAGFHAFFFHGRHVGFHHRAAFAFFDKFVQFGLERCCMGCQRMFGRDRAEGHAHDGVGAGGEYIHFAIADQLALRITQIVGEGKTHTVAFTNPVFLHQFDALRPAQTVQIVQ